MSSVRERTRALNDNLRIYYVGGTIALTLGIANLDSETIRKVEQCLTAFVDFDEANDPYGEHDFGGFEVDGYQVLFKIDYYSLDLKSGSPDPSDPAVTRRVLTLMLAEEY